MIHKLILIYGVFYALIFPSKTHAQILINEVSPVSTPEWVEIYNTGSNIISLNEYSINFGSDSQNLVFCATEQIGAGEFKIIELLSSWLANTGDVIILKNGDDEVDKIGYGTGYNLPKPDSVLKYLTRSPDGSSNWILNSQSSRQGSVVSFSCPTQVPTPTPTSVPTSTPEQEVFKASYRINNSKDSNGVVLNSVQIYVDGNYIHHEDEENMYFFNGHECYTGIDCDLGTHTISLRKSGYESWEDTQNFLAGANLEVNPILTKLKTASPSLTPTSSPIPTKKPTPTPTKTPNPTNFIASESGVLGIQEINEDTETPITETIQKPKNTIPALPFILVFGGLCFITFSIFSMIKNGKKNIQDS